MKKRGCLGFLFIFAISALSAALPPLAQTSREMQAILSDEHLQDLGSEQILKNLIRIESGYLILTQKYLMKVDVLYKSSHQKMGPVAFDLYFHSPIDLYTDS